MGNRCGTCIQYIYLFSPCLCSRDITTMKGTIVAQVDSSESFQEFCSTGCLGAYENKQNPPKSAIKTKCTVCSKLTEVSLIRSISLSLFLYLSLCLLLSPFQYGCPRPGFSSKPSGWCPWLLNGEQFATYRVVFLSHNGSFIRMPTQQQLYLTQCLHLSVS